MKLSKTSAFASLLLIGALSVGTASAMTDRHTTQLSGVVGISSVDLRVTVEDGVAYIFGNVDSGAESGLATQHVAGIEGVDKVVNLISVN